MVALVIRRKTGSQKLRIRLDDPQIDGVDGSIAQDSFINHALFIKFVCFGIALMEEGIEFPDFLTEPEDSAVDSLVEFGLQTAAEEALDVGGLEGAAEVAEDRGEGLLFVHYLVARSLDVAVDVV